jgi:hypothetical protein
MKFEDVAKHLREKVAPLSADKIIIITKEGDFFGRGRFSAVDGKLELEVILDRERELPRREGTTSRDQFWKIGCVIEEQVPVWTVGMPHQWNTQLALFSTHGARFDLDVVHSLTVPLGEYSLKKAVMIAANERNLGEDPQEHMYASGRLVNYDLIWCNLDSQTVQENDFLGKSSMIQSRYSAWLIRSIRVRTFQTRRGLRGSSAPSQRRRDFSACVSGYVFGTSAVRRFPTWTARLAAVGTD